MQLNGDVYVLSLPFAREGQSFPLNLSSSWTLPAAPPHRCCAAGQKDSIASASA